MKCPSEHLLSINKFTISNPITHIPPPTIFLPRHRCPVSMSPCPRSMHVALSSGFPFMQLRMLITGHQTRCLQSSFGLQKWHHSLGVFYLISSRTHLQSCSVVCRCRLCVGHPLAAFSLEPHREMLDWEPEYHSPCTLRSRLLPCTLQRPSSRTPAARDKLFGSSGTKRHYHLCSPADKHNAMCTTTLMID